MRYVHPKMRLSDAQGRLRAWLARRSACRPVLSPYILGRLGGEMARRMVEAALSYLAEQAVAQAHASFVEAALGKGGSLTDTRSKA